MEERRVVLGRGLSLGALLWAPVVLEAQAVTSLRNVPVPRPANLSQYVRDETLLIALGKALFWDQQTGSDGRFACASCHFHAGADHRVQNQLVNLSGPFVPNYTLRPADFPFRLLFDVNNNRSLALRDTSQVAGSAGLARRMFLEAYEGLAAENGYDSGDMPAFSLTGVNLRQVTARNTPSVINAVFNVRNFWDGRAAAIFTGVLPFGEADARENALVARDGLLVTERVSLDRSSLASQAVGPLLHHVEMSYDGRSWDRAARKILSLHPLAAQRIAPDDSVLGAFANSQGPGFASSLTYLDLVRAVFHPRYWSGPVSTEGFTHAEWNFPIFWGLAIQAYEATLVSADSPFDRFAAGDRSALNAQEQLGLGIFTGRGDCSLCHAGPEFTAAGFTSFNLQGAIQTRRGLTADRGFFRIGVRPPSEDVGLGGQDLFGSPLSLAVIQNRAGLGVDGAFKAPGLRNVEFTGPYFHNGGAATLEQVVEFYARGGDFPDGGVAIRPRNFNDADRAALVAFLKSLSDDRVRYERAPFDHPELCIPAGHAEAAPGVPEADTSDPRFAFTARDKWALLPAVGRGGNTVPLQTFIEQLEGIGTDGSRAHALTERCP
jgi:cytochrome c peroxidase